MRRHRGPFVALALVGALAALVGCTGLPASPAFTACGRTAADPSTTDLRPRVLTAADLAGYADRYGEIPEGRLVVESAGRLKLVKGMLGAGSGYEAATATMEGVQVVPSPVTADVSLLVLDVAGGGQLIAYVELRLADEPAVRWREEPKLGIGTDGGDGGFVATALAPALRDKYADKAADDMFKAFFPQHDAATWNRCLLRSTGGTVDGVLFFTGIGDGGYPTYLGLDQDGRVVAVVSEGWVVPWALSGLPGTPPEQH